MDLLRYDILWCLLYYTVNSVYVLAECPLHALSQVQMCTSNLGIGGPSQGPKPFVEKGKIEVATLACVYVLAECPLHALSQVQMCTSNLGIGGPSQGPKPFVEKGKIEVATLACRENKLNNAVKCLNDIMTVCQGNTEREHFLRMMIDVENIRQSVQYFCDNLHIYEDNAECIASSHAEQSKCVQQVRDNFKTKVDATPNMDVMLTSTCRFHSIGLNCSGTIIKSQCGQDASNIVVRMLQGFQPPKCRELKFDSGYSRVQTRDKEGRGPDNSANQQTVCHAILGVLMFCYFLNLS